MDFEDTVNIEWRELFPSEMLNEGVALFLKGKAKKPSEDADGFYATVRDDRNYHIMVTDRGDGIERMDCDCGRAEGGLCAHMAAALCLLEDVYDWYFYPSYDYYLRWKLLQQFNSAAGEAGRTSAAGKSGKTAEAKASGKTTAVKKSGKTTAVKKSAKTTAVKKSAKTAADQESGIAAADQESGKTAAVRKSGTGKAKPAAAKNAGTDGSSAASRTADVVPIDTAHREGILNINELSREDLGARKRSLAESGGGQSAKVESYSYFDYKAFFKGLTIPASVMRDARKLLSSGELTQAQISSGMMAAPSSIDRYTEDYSEHAPAQMRIRVVQKSKSQTWSVEQVYNWNTLEFSRCTSWRCNMWNYNQTVAGHELCVHEVATLLAMEQYLENRNAGDGTTLTGESFLRKFRGGISVTSVPREAAEPAQLLTMNPQVRIDEYDRWSVQFQIGAKRLYKIKDLPEFVAMMDAHEHQTFGKSTVLKLGREYLSPATAHWMRFIEDALNTVRTNSGLDRRRQDLYYYEEGMGWTKLTDRIPLVGEVLDHFAEELGTSLAEAERQGRKYGSRIKFNLTVRDGKLRPHLNVSPWYRGDRKRFEGVIITGEIPKLFYGSRYTYYLSDNELLRVSPDETARLAPVLDSADIVGMIDLKIGRSNLSGFYRKVLPELKEIAEVELLDPEVIESYLPEEPECVCYLDVDEDCVLCKPYVYYGTKQHSPFDVYGWEMKTVMPEHYRDEGVEAALMRLLETYLPERDESLQLFLTAKGELPLYEFLSHGLTELMEMADVHATDRFMRLKVRSSVSFEAGVSVKSGIMDLSLTSDELSPDELKRVFDGYRKKLTFIRLKNGDFLKLDQNEELIRLVELMNTLQVSPKEFAKGKMHIPIFRALYLDQMLEQMSGVYAERDSHFKKLIKEFKTISDADYEVPEKLRSIMRKYQKTGYRWMRTLDEYHFGGILADDMGLGKTLQAISVILADRNEIDMTTGEVGEALPSLIVCPASLIYNWEEELHRFAPSLSVSVIAGTQEERKLLIAECGSYDVVVTSYDLLKRDIAEYEDRTFRFEFIDEAQYIKNHVTAAAKSVKLIRAQSRFALTGTPIENRLSELWSIFDYLMPGFLYDYSTFRNEFELPIVKDEDKETLENLRRMVTPFILRRAKREVLKDLPDKLEEVRYAGFASGGQQQKLYNAQIVRMKEELRSQTEEDFRHSRIQILAELTRVRQICCDPSLCFEGYSSDSAKREACMELVRSVIDGEHKALIFSQFTSMLSLLEEDLKKEGIDYYVITGSTPKEKRLQLANDFNSDRTPVFLISLKAGGTGLNLTGADVVIHYDPWWNAAVQNQATDRAHRIGQDKVVTVYQLILRGTIEERILEMQNTKRALAEDILSADAVSSAAISREELLALLG